MFHSDYDSYPGAMIFRCLQGIMPQLEYIHWAEGGHSRFMDTAIEEKFFERLIRWLDALAASRSKSDDKYQPN